MKTVNLRAKNCFHDSALTMERLINWQELEKGHMYLFHPTQDMELQRDQITEETEE
jgi:hypothetical protein